MSNSGVSQTEMLRLLREQARAELERRALKTEPLIDFIPRISPRFRRPRHLAPLLRALERAEREPVRALVSVPPRHSKTETLLHGISHRISRRRYDQIAYVSYGDRLSKSKSRLARQYARRAGVQLRDDASALDKWMTPEMGFALFTSIGGMFTGDGAHLLIVDDPHKDRAEAESALHRDAVWEWYTGTAYTRLEPGGSIIITHTRWHPDDLIGRCLREHAHENWEYIRLPAINERGEALWPEQWPVEALEQKRKTIGEYDWLSQFQGEPVARGGAVFRDVRWYNPDGLSLVGARISIGIDLAYSGKTKSDYSACVVLAESGGRIYVLHVLREQEEVPAFVRRVTQISERYPGAPVHWHTSTTEAGLADLMRSLGLPVTHELARADKFVRAQSVAAAWNDGLVMLPGGLDVPSPSWVRDFVAEVTGFTGLGDRHDDMVDALASAFSVWARPLNARHEVYDYEDDYA